MISELGSITFYRFCLTFSLSLNQMLITMSFSSLSLSPTFPSPPLPPTLSLTFLPPLPQSVFLPKCATWRNSYHPYNLYSTPTVSLTLLTVSALESCHLQLEGLLKEENLGALYIVQSP